MRANFITLVFYILLWFGECHKVALPSLSCLVLAVDYFGVWHAFSCNLHELSCLLGLCTLHILCYECTRERVAFRNWLDIWDDKLHPWRTPGDVKGSSVDSLLLIAWFLNLVYMSWVNSTVFGQRLKCQRICPSPMSPGEIKGLWNQQAANIVETIFLVQVFLVGKHSNPSPYPLFPSQDLGPTCPLVPMLPKSFNLTSKAIRKILQICCINHLEAHNVIQVNFALGHKHIIGSRGYFSRKTFRFIDEKHFWPFD